MIKKLTLFAVIFIQLLSCSSQKKNTAKNDAQAVPLSISENVIDTLLITTLSTPFREKPDINSTQLKEIPSHVVLKSFEKVGNYYKVVLNDTTGYVPSGFVKSYAPQSTVVYPSSNKSSASPRNKSSKGCNAVQCSGTTKKGTRCRNITTNCNGRCYLH